VQVSKRFQRRQHNIVGDLAGAGRESAGNCGSDDRSHSRLHKRQAENVPALSVSKKRSVCPEKRKKNRERERERERRGGEPVRIAANERVTYARIARRRDNFRHLLFIG